MAKFCPKYKSFTNFLNKIKTNEDFLNSSNTFSLMWCNVKAHARGPGQAMQGITGQAKGSMVFSTKQQGT